MSDELSFDEWRREVNAKVRAIDGVIRDLMVLRNSYLSAGFPGGLEGRDLSPAQMRKWANSPWESDGSK